MLGLYFFFYCHHSEFRTSRIPVCFITTAVSMYRPLVGHHDSWAGLINNKIICVSRIRALHFLYCLWKKNGILTLLCLFFLSSSSSYRVPASTSETESNNNNNNNNSTSPRVQLGALSMMVYLRSMTGRAQLRSVCSDSTRSDLHEDNEKMMGPPWREPTEPANQQWGRPTASRGRQSTNSVNIWLKSPNRTYPM